MTASISSRRFGAVGAIALATSLILVQPAFASADVEGLLQNVVDMLTGNTARLLAVVLARLQGQFEVRAQEGRPEFGDQFFAGVSRITVALTSEVPVEP